MKKLSLFTALSLMLIVLFTACPQNGNPTKGTQNSTVATTTVETVQVPINLITSMEKATTPGGTNKGTPWFMTNAVRTGFEYVKKIKMTPETTTTTATGTTKAPTVVEETSESAKTFVEWDVGVSFSKDVDPLNPSLLVNHQVIYNNPVDSGADSNSLSVKYEDIKARLGRDIKVGDKFWIGFRAMSSKGDEIKRIVQPIEVVNPVSLGAGTIELVYGFDYYYLKATLTGKYPTTTATFYMGGDDKASAVKMMNEKGEFVNAEGKKVDKEKDAADAVVNGQITTTSGGTTNTIFICKLPKDKIKEGQPNHVSVTFKDVEADAKGLERTTNFESASEGIVYSTTASSAWNFQMDSTISTKKIALAEERNEVQLDKDDPTLTWDDMKTAVGMYDYTNTTALLNNDVYRIRIAETKEGIETAEFDVYKITPARKAVLKGLKYNTVYYAQVEYSYDINKANSIARKTHLSPIVSFKTVDILTNPVYTFDSGKEIGTSYTGVGPNALKHDNSAAGAVVNKGGNPSNALSLPSGKTIESQSMSKTYSSAKLEMDVILPANLFSALTRSYASITTATHKYYDTEKHKIGVVSDTAGPGYIAQTSFWEFKAENVSAKLVYIAPYFTTDAKDYTDGNAHNWTLVDGGIYLVIYDGKGDTKSAKLFDVKTSITKETVDASLVTKKELVTELKGLKYNELTTTFTSGTDRITYKYETVINEKNNNWTHPYKITIELNKKEVKVTAKSYMKDAAGKDIPEYSAKCDVTNTETKILGYYNFTFTSKTDLLIDNVKYEVTDKGFSRKIK